MTNTLYFPNIEAVQQSAAQWLAAIDRGLTEQESNDLDVWLSESPIHGETLVAFAADWDKMDVLSAVSKILPLETVEIPDSLNHEEMSGDWLSPFKKRPLQWSSGIVAAALLIASVVSITVLKIDSQAKPYFTAVYESVVGNQREVTLPDGSILKLNTDTELHVSFSNERRQVHLLRGEAYFDVVTDPNLPFIALVNSDSVTAVGTAFNIQKNTQDDFEVLVTEGRVRVEKNIDLANKSKSVETIPSKRHLSLSMGERARISKSTFSHQIETLTKETIGSDLAWHNGLIVFEGQTLKQAIAEISRYTSINIDIVDPSVEQIEVGGFFKAGDTEQLLFVLEQNFGIHSQRQGNTILLSALEENEKASTFLAK